MPGRSQGTSQQPCFHHLKYFTVYQLMWFMPYELSTVYKIKLDNHRAHCINWRYIFILINLLSFRRMLSEYNSNNVIIVICATPWVFSPLNILLEYWIEHVTFGLLYVVFTFPTGISCWGSSRLCVWLSLQRLMPWINHLPLVCWSTFWNLV